MKKWVVFLFVGICFLTVVLFIAFNFLLPKKDFGFYVEKYSAEFGLEESFVYAIIKAESNFQEDAVSKSGALGLMQIIPSTARWIANEFDEDYSREKMFSADTNIKYGCFYLRYLFDKFEDRDVVICAYNAGETVVKKWLDENGKIDESKIAYQETKVYLSRVRDFCEFYKT